MIHLQNQRRTILAKRAEDVRCGVCGFPQRPESLVFQEGGDLRVRHPFLSEHNSKAVGTGVALPHFRGVVGT